MQADTGYADKMHAVAFRTYVHSWAESGSCGSRRGACTLRNGAGESEPRHESESPDRCTSDGDDYVSRMHIEEERV